MIKYPEKTSSIWNAIKLYCDSKEYDVLLLNYAKHVFLLGLMNLVFPKSCKIIVLDLFLPHPNNQKSILCKIQKIILEISLQKIHKIILYSKCNEELSQAYNINNSKIKYVPFKVNSLEYLKTQQTSDQGYIFSGGQSRRDFNTLLEACNGLPYPVRIVTPIEKYTKVHGSLLDESRASSNVQITHDNGSFESFVSNIAQSRFVVIPTKQNDFASTGTSVYLISMALKKCVIISEGPATKGILSEDLAVTIPPEDPLALRRAIQKVYEDDLFRQNIAQNGYNYAASLGDQNTLYKSLLREIEMSFEEVPFSASLLID